MWEVLYGDDCDAIRKYLDNCPKDIDININYPIYDYDSTECLKFPFLFAIEENRTDVVDLFISKGTDVNICNTFDSTGISIAAREGLVDIVDRLLAANADANICDLNGETAIMQAAYAGHYEIVKMLTICSDFTKYDDYGETAINNAIYGTHYEIVEYLLGLGLNINHVNCNNESYLHYAVHRGNLDIIKLLIEKGIDINLENNHGKTAIQTTSNPEILALFATI